MKTRKGTVTVTHYIVLLIVLLICAFVIFLFISYYNWKGESRIRACHEQVVYRNTFNIGAIEVGRSSIPLSACMAEHVCFVTSNKEECGGLKGLEDIQKIKIENKEDIVKTLADKMQLCWEMVGEGNLEYQPKGWFTEWEHNYCGICDKIAFSEEVNEDIDKIYYKELYDYMKENTISGSEKTYMQYLYRRDSLDNIRDFVKGEVEKKEDFKEEADIYKYYINTSNGYAIITSINKEGWMKQATGVITGLGLGVAAIVFSPIAVGIGGGAIILGTSAGGGAAIISLVLGKDVEYAPPQLVVYDVKHREIIKSLGCDSFNFLP